MKIQLTLCLAVLALCFYSASFSQNIYTVAGNGNIGYGGDGYPATSGYCEMWGPFGICMDKSGNIFIAEANNNVVRKINTNGIISTYAGIRIEGYGGYCGDGGPATNAELNVPEGLVADSSGNILIADLDNAVIRIVNTSGIISTFIGSGRRGYGGDGGPATAAEMNLPDYVYIDTKDNIYISEYVGQRIRIVNTSGIINTLAGNGISGYTGDGGPASMAEIGAPLGICADSSGNIFLAQGVKDIIRKINTNGIISTIAGNGTTGFSGDGGPATNAELNFPSGFCFDKTGNLLVCDGGNNKIRQINTSGIISTIAGDGVMGYFGDGGLASSAELYGPWGICLNAYENICFTDEGNNVARKILLTPEGTVTMEDYNGITVFPNPVQQQLNIQGIQTLQKLKVKIIDITGRILIMSELTLKDFQFSINVSTFSSGIYILNLTANNFNYTNKFIKI